MKNNIFPINKMLCALWCTVTGESMCTFHVT